MSLGYAGSTPPRTMSPVVTQGPSDSSAGGLGIVSPNVDGSGVGGILHRRSNSKHGSGAIGAAEKHRLSLTFLRRTGSVSHSNAHSPNGAISPGSASSTSPVGVGRRTHAMNNSIDAQLAENSGTYPVQSPGGRPRGPSSGEDSLLDGTKGRQSSESDLKSGGSKRSRVGSVKKRLSMLGMGNKDGRMRTGFTGVREE